MNSRPKILAVDDRPENLVALETVLRDLDIDLVKANSGNEALRQTLHHDFTLALLDIQMPDMDGYELAGILREEEKTARLPFIFISAVYTDNLNVFKGYENGAFSFITKPFQPEILINKVKFFIEKHQQEVALYKLNRDLERKNEELALSNQELEAFSYHASHDLRAPLRAINGYSSMLAEDYADQLPQDVLEVLDKLKYNSTKMGRLIDELLSFARLGKKAIEKQKVDMALIAERVSGELKRSHSFSASVRIAKLPPAMADEFLFNQVFTNLIYNALKYSSRKENPEVEIDFYTEDGKTIYFVKDNGAGFDMKYADKLFGVFQRLHTENEFEGNGIGLALVKKILLKHGGQITADGKVNEGATFSFWLPE